MIGKWRHLYQIRQAKKILNKIKEISLTNNYQGKIINYLRKINPYVFEEMILTVIENSNIRIYRNKKYSGDGGIDGKFKIKQGKVIIQCKRYKSFINTKDVIELSNKVKNDKYYLGIFVHTGKTNDASKQIMRNEKNIIFLSGDKLINFLINKENIKDIILDKIKRL